MLIIFVMCSLYLITFKMPLICTKIDKSYSSGGSRISRRGGVDVVGGGVDSRGGYVSKILYVKTKELGPLGGGRAPTRSANVFYR